MKKFLSVLLAVMMVLSTVSFAAPSAVTVTDTAVEAPVVEIPEVEETAKLAADISNDTATYGDLIFELNFDNLEVQSNSGATTFKFADAGYINPAFTYTYGYLTEKGSIYTNQYSTVAIKERAAGDKYYEVTGGTTGYAVVLLQSGTERGFQGEDGIYTLTADVYRPDAMPLTTRFTGSTAEDTPKQDFTGLNDAGWGSMVLQHDPSCYGNGGHAVPITSAKDVRTIKFHRNGGETQTVGYDNIKLYYKPLTVDVTVKAGGKSATKTVSTLEAVSIADLSKELGLGVLYNVTGAKVGDKTYAASDSVLFVKDTTVELTVEKLDSKYIHPTHGLMLYDIDFEQSASGTEISQSNSEFNVGAYATPVASKVMSHAPNNWHLNSSGFTLNVMADPADATNLVAGIKGATSTGYPALILTTYSNGASARYGFIEDNDIVLTIEYDYYDTTADGIALRFGGKSSVSENEGHTKWTTLEDTCVESNNGRAASKWYKNTGVYSAANASRMGGTDEISFVKMHTASPSNADLYWDNVRLYYRPAHVDLKVDANGMSDVTIATPTLTDSATSLTVSALLAAAGVDYSAVSSLSYTFKGVSLDPDGETVYGLNDTIGFVEDSTVYLIFEEVDMSEWQDENGILLYEVNFDGIADGTQINNGAKLSTFGRVNPYIEGSENWYLNLSGFGTVANNDYGVVSGGTLKLLKTATGKWSQVQLSGETVNNKNEYMMIADGTIYKEASMKVVATSGIGFSVGLTGYARKWDGSKWTGSSSNQNSVHTINNATSGQWYDLAGSKTLEGLEYNSESCTIFLPTYNETGGLGDEYYLDNLKLYWKPAKANVTIVGGQNEDFETVTIKNVSTASTLDELIALIPGSVSDFGKITGLATEDGEKITSLSLVSDIKLQALWSPFVIVEGGQEFSVDASNVSSGGSNQWNASYGNTDEVGNGGAQVTGAISWMYANGWKSTGGNLFVTTDTVAIGEKNTGAANDPATWATPAVHSINDMIRENVNTNLAAGNDAQYVLTKYRYDNLPNLAEVYANDPNPEGKKYTLSADGLSLTYYGRTGDTQYTFKMAPDYGKKYYIQCLDNSYQYGGGEEFHQNELMVEDEWYYDLLPVNSTMQTKGVKYVIIQTWNRFDQQVTEYDYVRFVKLGAELAPVVPEEPAPEYAPESSTETSYRTAAPNGIRFKAEMTAEINTLASDYGWVVGRAVKVTEDTLLIGAENTITAYGRENGYDLKKFYEETDDLKTFTAIVYNIPAGNEDDVLCIKPFVKVDGEVYYGKMISKSPREVAEAHDIDVSLLMKAGN